MTSGSSWSGLSGQSELRSSGQNFPFGEGRRLGLARCRFGRSWSGEWFVGLGFEAVVDLGGSRWDEGFAAGRGG